MGCGSRVDGGSGGGVLVVLVDSFVVCLLCVWWAGCCFEAFPAKVSCFDRFFAEMVEISEMDEIPNLSQFSESRPFLYVIGIDIIQVFSKSQLF